MKDLHERSYRLWLDTKDLNMGAAMHEFESFALEIRNEALEEAAMTCDSECDKRVVLAKNGHKYPQILLGEASGATNCADAIRALNTDALAAKENTK